MIYTSKLFFITDEKVNTTVLLGLNGDRSMELRTINTKNIDT